jgi:alkanesulfonate monooxygenase SsuD/methylene tetrahydromethanopterin reductase-like flavin-dependent oxidoreductase (luciferase family)
MATILARTDRVRVFPDVACLPLRPPAVMAKAAASLDVISGGRFELGLGASGSGKRSMRWAAEPQASEHGTLC